MAEISADLLTEIHNSTFAAYLDRGKVLAQDVQDKPLLAALEGAAGSFSGAQDRVILQVKQGKNGVKLQGYSGDERLTFNDWTGTKPVEYRWKEHWMGVKFVHSDLKQVGIDVIDTSANQRVSNMSEADTLRLANFMDEKYDTMDEDYMASLNDYLWGDGTLDPKVIAGVRSFILDNPASGSTGGLSRAIYPWWRNRAATTAANAAGTGDAPIVSSATGGGVLIQYLQKEERQRRRYGTNGSKIIRLCGSDFIDAYERELRANGSYTQTGFAGSQDGAMGEVKHAGVALAYDPTLDDMGYAKRCYTIDVGSNGIRLLYMDGQRKKKHNPARPYDRLVMYSGVSMTGVLVAKRLRTSGVYDIA